MRVFLPLFAVIVLCAQTRDSADAVAVVQKLFDAMAAHDAVAMRSVLLPDTRLHSIRDQGPAITTADAFVTQIAAAKSELRERFTSAPSVLVHGRIAQVWGEYDFHRDGKFTHCGVDTVTLFKTAEGWKIATLAYTVETTGCRQE